MKTISKDQALKVAESHLEKYGTFIATTYLKKTTNLSDQEVENQIKQFQKSLDLKKLVHRE